MKFTKKTVMVEAWPVDTLKNMDFDAPEFPQAIRNEIDIGTFYRLYQDEGEFGLVTRDGFMRAYSGDWIVQDENGYLYLCKPDTFNATFDPVVAV